jgi:hypothetical protein
MLLLSDGMEHVEIPSPRTVMKMLNYFLITHTSTTPFPFKLHPSLLFRTSFTVATSKFKQKCQTPLSVLYDHHTGCQMDVNSKDGTLSM